MTKFNSLGSFSNAYGARVRNLKGNSQQMEMALNDIGNKMVSQTQTQIRARRLIDTGALLRSIVFDTRTNNRSGTVRLGSPLQYAAVHEFGANKSNVGVKAHTKSHDHAWRNPIDPPITVGVVAHKRNVKFRKRPYVRPVIMRFQATAAKRIGAALRKVMRG
jgi:phage gpG-like protein